MECKIIFNYLNDKRSQSNWEYTHDVSICLRAQLKDGIVKECTDMNCEYTFIEGCLMYSIVATLDNYKFFYFQSDMLVEFMLKHKSSMHYEKIKCEQLLNEYVINLWCNRIKNKIENVKYTASQCLFDSVIVVVDEKV